MTNREYVYFIVVLTKQGKLVEAYVRATSVSVALDKMIAQLDLAGQIVDYRLCIRGEQLS